MKVLKNFHNEGFSQDDNLKKYIIGFENDKATDLETTLKQIVSMNKFDLCISDKKIEKILREAHDKHLKEKCKKYQARLSITLV